MPRKSKWEQDIHKEDTMRKLTTYCLLLARSLMREEPTERKAP